jgi:hypothetical protein
VVIPPSGAFEYDVVLETADPSEPWVTSPWGIGPGFTGQVRNLAPKGVATLLGASPVLRLTGGRLELSVVETLPIRVFRMKPLSRRRWFAVQSGNLHEITNAGDLLTLTWDARGSFGISLEREGELLVAFGSPAPRGDRAKAIVGRMNAEALEPGKPLAIGQHEARLWFRTSEAPPGSRPFYSLHLRDAIDPATAAFIAGAIAAPPDHGTT